MDLTEDIKKYIDKSVLCWLATASKEGFPNVSPKECFSYFGDNSIIIANIASPQSVKNIKQNEHVCLSFIEIFIQKGYQIKGRAEIVDVSHPDFSKMKIELQKITGDKFPFATITKIEISHVKSIIAPSYFLYPETREEDRIRSAKKTYGVQ